MNNQSRWKLALSGVVLSSLLVSATPASILLPSIVHAEDSSVIDTRYPAVLQGPVQAKVKSILSEKTLSGTRLGAVIKMYNVSGETVRVPDHELRIMGSDGATYTLRASADNQTSIQPMSSIELSYLVEIDMNLDIQPSQLSWVYVDKDVYPKQETTLLSLPLANLVWFGDQSAVADPEAIKAWRDAFTIPKTDSAIQYTPVALTTEYKAQTPVKVVKLLAYNPGSVQETIPAFTFDGRSDKKVYKGTRADQSVTKLDPGEKKYLYFAIPTEQDATLTGFTLLTAESFKQAASTPFSYTVGRIGLQMPKEDQALDNVSATPYTMNTPIAFDPLSTAVLPDIDVSAVDLQMYQNNGEGYQTAVLRMKFTNKSDLPIPVPQLAADLVNGLGVSYAGTRLNAAAPNVLPHTDYLIHYSFVVPNDEKTDVFTLRLSDDKTAAPYKATVARPQVQLTNAEPDKLALAFYPYEIKVKSWLISNIASMNGQTLTYDYKFKLKMSWDVQSKENVIVDTNYSRMLLEFENTSGRRLTSLTLNVTGENKITSGEQIYLFNNTQTDQLEYPLTLKVYEIIDTPNGQARKLVGQYQQ